MNTVISALLQSFTLWRIFTDFSHLRYNLLPRVPAYFPNYTCEILIFLAKINYYTYARERQVTYATVLNVVMAVICLAPLSIAVSR